MTELKIEISPEDVQQALQEALTKALTPEKCTELVRDAVAKLLQGSWQSPSELQQIFHFAAEKVARAAAEAEMAKPENMAKIAELVSAAWLKAFDADNREKVVDKVAGAITTAIVGRGY